MSLDFKLKQHLKMSLNAQIKNLVPESLSDIPIRDDWRLGRIWFNTTIGKLQGVFLKLDTQTGLPLVPEEWEIRVVGADALGPTKDGEYWPDGLLKFDEQTKIADAMDEVNEALKDLAPSEATLLMGDLVTNIKYITGKISKQNILMPDNVELGILTPGDTITYIVNDNNINGKLPTIGLVNKGVQQSQFGRADQGIINLFVDGIAVDEGINLFDAFNEKSRDYYGIIQGYDAPIIQQYVDDYGISLDINANPNKDKYISSTGTLVVNKVERYNNFKKWQRGTGSISLTTNAGIHDFYVIHSGISTGEHKTNKTTIFYDPNKVIPSVEINGLHINSGTIKYISGIPFFTTDVSFSVDMRANDLFSYTYWDKPISITLNGNNKTLLDWNQTGSSLNGLTVPMWNDIFDISSYVIPYNTPNTAVNSITLKVKAGKPATGWGVETVETKKILIDTYPINNNSNNLKETFLDEYYRLDDTLVNFNVLDEITTNIGLWDSSIQLIDGNAQVFMGSLIKAKNDFNEYGINIDYSTNNGGDQLYYRSFTSFDKPNSNGILQIITPSKIGVDFDVYLKFPGLTAWLNINVLFDSVIFAKNFNVDGTGCGTKVNITPNGYEIPWSMGTFSTYDSGYTYVIKIVLKTDACTISEIAEIAETWR